MSRGERLAARLRRHVDDERVLSAIAEVPRELFVPRRWRHAAWGNRALPIGEGQSISQPLVVARMCELLALGGDERVLDVGTGSGYHAAVLARLAAHVWTIERRPELAQRAAEALAAAGVDNVTPVVGDGTLGHPDAAPFDAVNVAAAASEVPPALEQQLAIGGRLVVPVDGEEQRLVLIRRGEEGMQRVAHEPVRFVALVEDREG